MAPDKTEGHIRSSVLEIGDILNTREKVQPKETNPAMSNLITHFLHKNILI